MIRIIVAALSRLVFHLREQLFLAHDEDMTELAATKDDETQDARFAELHSKMTQTGSYPLSHLTQGEANRTLI